MNRKLQIIKFCKRQRIQNKKRIESNQYLISFRNRILKKQRKKSIMKKAKFNNQMKNVKMMNWKFVTQPKILVSKESQKKKGKQKEQSYKTQIEILFT